MELAILKQNKAEKKSPSKTTLIQWIGKIILCFISIFVISFIIFNYIVFRFLPRTEMSIKVNGKTATISFGKDTSARWEVVGPGIIRFNGSWEKDGGSTEQLKELLKEPIYTVRIVDSFGGDVDEAINDATLLLSVRPRIVVEGACYSSCANYLLPVAKEIDVRNGAVIAYHGHVCELAPESETCQNEKNFWAKLPSGELNSRLPSAFRIIEETFPLNSKSWMPTPEDFTKYGYPPMRFDWLPKTNEVVMDGAYYAPLPD